MQLCSPPMSAREVDTGFRMFYVIERANAQGTAHPAWYG